MLKLGRKSGQTGPSTSYSPGNMQSVQTLKCGRFILLHITNRAVGFNKDGVRLASSPGPSL